MSSLNITISFEIDMAESGLNFQNLVSSWNKSGKDLSSRVFQEILAAFEEWGERALRAQFPGRFEGAGWMPSAKTWETPFGTVRHRYKMLKDRWEEQRFSPLREVLCIPARAKYPGISLGGVVRLAPEMSFRKASREVRESMGVGPGKSWAYSVFRRETEGLDLDCRQKPGSRIPYTMIPDGTGIKIQENRQGSRKSEVRIVLGMDKTGKITILDRTADISWEEIAARLDKRYRGEAVFLVGDGEPGFMALLGEKTKLQRCLVHGWRGLSYALYQDGFKKDDQELFKMIFMDNPAFFQDKDAIQKLPEWSKRKLRKMLRDAEAWCDEFHRELPKAARRAREYIRVFKIQGLTYLRGLLDDLPPTVLNTNAAENAFSRTDTRLKSIGKGRWSVAGVVAMINAILAKAYNPKEWERFIQQLTGACDLITLRSLKVSNRWIVEPAYT